MSYKGKEFTEHREVARQLKIRLYFSHAYASWQRGRNENANGLLRQYFPKKGKLR